MKRLFKRIEHTFEQTLNAGVEALNSVFSRDVHHVIITGLSRSGKSMFFTSLMTLLSQRAQSDFDNLPLLDTLPKSLFDSVALRPIAGEELFPLERNLAQLQQRKWPDSTEKIYGFELVITRKPDSILDKLFNRHTEVVLRFYDYPGEWLTDLPMLHKDFVSWSDSAWAQQLNPPQKYFATSWHDFVAAFDFEQPPNEMNRQVYLQQYREFLTDAKAQGITLLQPGSMLIPSGFDWQKSGFAPLPSRIASDPHHPWSRLFKVHFNQFQQHWLKPLQEAYFCKADKQIVMLDLHEGLSHSRDHLKQLKETLSNLSNSFAYGASKWYKPKVLFREEISKVAFVATKADLLPLSQHANFMQLLQDITAGVRGHLAEQQVEFQHFLISAIQSTDSGSCADCLRFTNLDGDYEEWEFAPLPSSLKAFEANQTYPRMETKVPSDVLARINHAQGIDRLIDYLIH
ncbi:hypothetical protein THMIRHAS_09660 [Thiosulfatimonas sediminis]|uniref:YcjX family protein n=1 Tax=Thiosulfatimonas sediminis TaxID=2675054 RepID=A0A6F8PTX5_9GAMM|nr:YcjX family protein [Thiosulfatimonas sediminis]BBP45593.1 hypothetical protein THMIRHAS_09660 [Thiosulfatimonas sediminis]